MGIATEGVLTRTVADTAAALDVIAGYEPGDPFSLPATAQPFSSFVGRDPGRLRIGFWTSAPNGVPVHAECVRAVHETARALEALGHHVEERAPDWLDDGYAGAWDTVLRAAMGELLRSFGVMRGRAIEPSMLEPASQVVVAAARSISASSYLEALALLQRLARRMLVFWEDHDVFVSPAIARPPPPIGSMRPESPNDFAPFAARWNLTGQPAISLPVHWSSDDAHHGLPIGVQLVGPPAGDALLIAVAAQMEARFRWDERRPSVAGG